MSIVLYNTIENIIKTQLIKHLIGKSNITVDDIEQITSFINEMIKKNVDNEVERELVQHTEYLEDRSEEACLESKKAKVLARISEWCIIINTSGEESSNFKSNLKEMKKHGVVVEKIDAPCDITTADDSEFLTYGKYQSHWDKYLTRFKVKSSDKLNNIFVPYVGATWKEILKELKSSTNITKTLEALMLAEKKDILAESIGCCQKKALSIINDKIKDQRYYCCKRKRSIEPQESCFNKKTKLMNK